MSRKGNINRFHNADRKAVHVRKQKGERGTDAFDIYLSEISDIGDFLTKEEALQLVREAQQGSLEARNRLVINYLPVVIAIAKRFYRSCRLCRLSDLVSEGNMALWQAACHLESFDLERGTDPKTYFASVIYNTFRSALVNIFRSKWILPQYLKSWRRRLSLARSKLAKQGKRKPAEITLLEIAKYLGEPEDMVQDIYERIHSPKSHIPVLSLDAMNAARSEEENTSLLETLEAKPIFDETRNDRLHKALMHVLDDLNLNERQQEVIILHEGLNGDQLNHENIGELWGTSKAWAQNVQMRAMQKLCSSDVAKSMLSDFVPTNWLPDTVEKPQPKLPELTNGELKILTNLPKEKVIFLFKSVLDDLEFQVMSRLTGLTDDEQSLSTRTIAKTLGITRSKVNTIENHAMKKIRNSPITRAAVQEAGARMAG